MMNLNGDDPRVYRLGARLASRRSETIVLDFERRKRPDIEAIHGFVLHTHNRF